MLLLLYLSSVVIAALRLMLTLKITGARLRVKYENKRLPLRAQISFADRRRDAFRVLESAGVDMSLFNYTITYTGREIGPMTKSRILKNAYVGFCSAGNYLALMENAIRSVHRFSLYPMLLFYASEASSFTMDAYQFPRLVVYLIPPEHGHIWFTKVRSALIAPVLNAQIVEADALIWSSADLLFSRIAEEINDDYPYPMLTRHWDIRAPTKGPGTYYPLSYPMDKRSMPYMHAHLTWGYASLPALAEVYVQLYRNMYPDDEMALNRYLWERGVKKQWCRFDPFFSEMAESNRSNAAPFQQDVLLMNLIHGDKTIKDQQRSLLFMDQMARQGWDRAYFVRGQRFFFDFQHPERRLNHQTVCLI